MPKEPIKRKVTRKEMDNAVFVDFEGSGKKPNEETDFSNPDVRKFVGVLWMTNRLKLRQFILDPSLNLCAKSFNTDESGLCDEHKMKWFGTREKAEEEVIELLLAYDSRLKELLFDFSEPFKIDLEAFMKSHFTYNVPIKQFAKLTGRSISTFKRDFKKTFSQTPEKWLKDMRLDKAHFLISEKKQKPSEVYLQVGFENFSHFSTSFKERFGYNASTV